MAAALFIQREAPGGVVAIDTTAGNLPESARDLLETNTIILADTGRAVLRFGEVRAAGGGTYDVDAELRLDTVTRHLRFIVECQSRHCLVMDTTTIESSTRSN
jgi:hypothetical protein